MRICLVTETFPPEINGVARTLGELSRGLVDRGHELQLVRPNQGKESGQPNGPWELFLTAGYPIPFYPGLRLGLPAYNRLKTLWRENRPDVVHIATEGPLGCSALMAARSLGIEVCSSFHTNFHQYSKFYGYAPLTRFAIRFLRAFHNRAAATLVPTGDVVALLREEGFERLDVLSRGVDTELFSPTRRSEELRASWGVASDELVVAYVGRLAPEKSPDLAMRAFDRVVSGSESGTKVHGLVVGDGPARQEMEAAMNPELASRMIFAGMRRGEDLARHYASADVLIFPSRTETFGNVILEAMASGLPVASYDYAAARLLMKDGEHGRLTELGDEDAWLAAVESLTTLPRQELGRMGGLARTRAESESWSGIVQRFESQLTAVRYRGVPSTSVKSCQSVQNAAKRGTKAIPGAGASV